MMKEQYIYGDNLIDEKTKDQFRDCMEFPDAKIVIVDSEATAMALGFQVLAAARGASDGKRTPEGEPDSYRLPAATIGPGTGRTGDHLW